MSGPVVACVVAHPDDECYSAAGALALAARSGATVYVVSLTRGEDGKWAESPPPGGPPLAEVRAAELTSACAVIGARAPTVLDLPDGLLAEHDLVEGVAAVVRVLRALRPDIVVTHGMDGGYGHPDHVATCKLVTAAVPSAGVAARFDASFGPPHQVAEVLFLAFPRGLMRPMYDHMLRGRHAGGVRHTDPAQLGVGPADLAVRVDVREVADLKLRAIACHRSQLREGDPRTLLPDGIVDRLLMEEWFVRAGGRVGRARRSLLPAG